MDYEYNELDYDKFTWVYRTEDQETPWELIARDEPIFDIIDIAIAIMILNE